jgi:hypothetical protein
MKAVWGKMDPNKRINTFEVSYKVILKSNLDIWP